MNDSNSLIEREIIDDEIMKRTCVVAAAYGNFWAFKKSHKFE